MFPILHLTRRDQLPVMRPARECFYSAEAPCLDVNLGLIVRSEFAVLKSASDIAFELLALGYTVQKILCKPDDVIAVF